MLLLKQALARNTFRSDPLRYTEHGWRWFLGRGHDLSTRGWRRKEERKKERKKETIYLVSRCLQIDVLLPVARFVARSSRARWSTTADCILRFPAKIYFAWLRRCKLDERYDASIYVSFQIRSNSLPSLFQEAKKDFYARNF